MLVIRVRNTPRPERSRSRLLLERRRRGNRLKERDPEAGNRLGPAVSGAPDLEARGESKPPWCNSPKGETRTRTPTIPTQGAWSRRHRTLASDGERDSPVAGADSASWSPGSKGEGFFRSLASGLVIAGGSAWGIPAPSAFHPPPAGLAAVSPRRNPRNDEGLSQSPLQKTSPFPPCRKVATRPLRPGSGLERRRRGNHLKERGREAGNRLGPAVPGAPDLEARGESKPLWCNSPKGGSGSDRRRFPLRAADSDATVL